MSQIETVIHGSSGECREAAGWLAALGSAATAAADDAQAARMTSTEGWWGPAAAAFTEGARIPRDNCDDLALTCSQYQRGLNDFADSLENMGAKMNDTVDKAVAGDLTVADAYIHPPDPATLGSRPRKPSGGGGPALETYNEQAAAYNARADEHNAKVKVFNECSDIAKEIRVQEEQAHVNLVGDLAAKGEFADWSIGVTSAEVIVQGGDTLSQTRTEALRLINDLDGRAADYTALASARHSDLTPEAQQRFKEAAQKAGANRDRYLSYLRRYEDGVMPERFRTDKTVPARRAAYQGPPPADGGPRRAAGVVGAAEFVAKRLGKAIPLIGDGLTVAQEAVDVYHGKQSIPAAVVRSVGIIGAGYIGSAVVGTGVGALAGAIGGVVAGSPTGPGAVVTGGAGAAVGAIIGGVVGDIAFSEMADRGLQSFFETYLPGDVHPDQNQPRAAEADRI